jgi:hypothetical protein
MKHRILALLSVVISGTVLFGAPASAQPREDLSGRWASLLSDQFGMPPPFGGSDKIVISQPSNNKSLVLFNLERLSFKTEYVEKDVTDSVKALSLDSNYQVRALASSSIIEKFLKAEGEAAYSSSNSLFPSLTDPKMSDRLLDKNRQFLRFGLNGGLSDLTYGLEYRSAGKDFANLSGGRISRDKGGAELWMQQKFGIASLKTSLSDISNNVARDPSTDRTTKLLGGASLKLAPASWPALSIYYSRGTVTKLHVNSTTTTGELQNFGTSLYYGISDWSATLSAGYSLKNVSEVQTATPEFSLDLSYTPRAMPIKFVLDGYYSRNKANVAYYEDDSSMNLTGALVWTLRDSGPKKSTLSFGASYDRYLDALYGGSYSNTSVWLRLKIPVF